MNTVNEKMTTICNNIRNKTNETELLGLDEIAMSIDKVYEAGKTSEHSTFWDGYISSDGILNYSAYHFAGSGWGDSTFYPPKDIVFKGGANGLFRNCFITNLKNRLSSLGITIDTSQATNLQYAFAYNKMTYLPKISTVSATDVSYIFGQTQTESNIIWIDELEVSANNSFKNSFNYATTLTHVIFTGVLGQNNLNVQWSPLDKDSLLSIVNCLEDKTADTSGTEWIITLGSANIATLETAPDSNGNIIDGKAIAISKGWSVK